MKMSRLLFIFAVVSLPASAFGGISVPISVNVPVYTPWGAIAVAAVLGVSGAYAILKKRK